MLSRLNPLVLATAMISLSTLAHAQGTKDVKWRIAYQTGDEKLGDVAQAQREEAARNSTEIREDIRALEANYVRGLISDRQYLAGLQRLNLLYGKRLDDFKQRQAELNSRIRARVDTLKERQPYAPNEEERAMLRIFDKAVSDGKVPAESLVGARNTILSGTHDAASTMYVLAAVAYCRAQLAADDQERAKYLKLAHEAREKHLKWSKPSGDAPTGDRSTSP